MAKYGSAACLGMLDAELGAELCEVLVRQPREAGEEAAVQSGGGGRHDY